ncbi:MAG: SseB family protein [Carbonactinosporaceae bacterium]
MTSPSPEGQQAVETELAQAMEAGDQESALRIVANAAVVVPQAASAPGDASPNSAPGAVTLPVLEQEGRQYVPVFMTSERMTEAAPDVEESITLPVSQLAASWPDDELWLAVNPGVESGVTIPPDIVRTLPQYRAA